MRTLLKGKIMPRLVYGQCTNCGCVEVALANQEGFQDLSSMGESRHYPYGSPCEVCVQQPNDFRSATAPDNWVRGTTYEQMLTKK